MRKIKRDFIIFIVGGLPSAFGLLGAMLYIVGIYSIPSDFLTFSVMCGFETIVLIAWWSWLIHKYPLTEPNLEF